MKQIKLIFTRFSNCLGNRYTIQVEVYKDGYKITGQLIDANTEEDIERIKQTNIKDICNCYNVSDDEIEIKWY